MKPALCFCLMSSILALGAPSAYAKPHAHKKKPSALSAVAWGRRAPIWGAKAAPALDVAVRAEPPAPEVMKHPRASFWLAADPHVPLATVEGRAIRSVGKRGKECGAASRWANPRSRWHAVD